MSLRIWEDIANQKKQVEVQRETILNAFKQKKVADEMGTMKAEKLFKPITKMLGKRAKEEEKEKFPDYTVAGEEINFMHELPFGEADPYENLKPFTEAELEEDPYENLKPFTEAELKDEMASNEKKVENYEDFEEWLRQEGYESEKDITPLPKEKNLEEVKPIPVPEELGPEVPPGEKQLTASLSPSLPSYSQATKGDDPPAYKEPKGVATKDLNAIQKALKNMQPGATVPTKKSKFYGWTKEALEYRRDEIYTERANDSLEKGKSAIGQKHLGPYEGKSQSEMAKMIEEFSKKTPPKTGKGLEGLRGQGFGDLIKRLSLGISSIVAGNTSVKLRKEIYAIAKMLHKQGTLSKEQLNKVLSIK